MLSRAIKAEHILRAFHLFVTVGVGCSVFSVSAAEWELAPFVEISETYTDNLSLKPAGQEESEYVTQLNPGFRLTGTGRYLDLSFSYRLQNLFYSKASNRSNSNHQLLANMNTELLREFLFFDASASLLQRIIDPEGNIGQGNIAFSGNRRNVATVSLSPYLKTRIGSWSLAEVRYTRSRVRSLDGTAGDSVADAVSGQFANAKSLGRWSWQVGFSSRYVEYTTGLRPDERWKNIDLAADYRFSRKIDVRGTVGYEDNEYQRGGGITAPKGAFWNVTVNWHPTPRTNLVVGRGERYFGPAWNFNLEHRARRSTITGGYTHELSSRRQYMLDVSTFDQYSNPTLDSDTAAQAVGPIPVNEVFIRQRVSLGTDFRTLKSKTALNVYTEYRDYQLSGREEDIIGSSLSWLWNFNRRDSLTFATNTRRTDIVGEYLDRLLTLRASFERKFGRRLTTTFDARRTARERGIGSDYTENLLTARLTLNW